MLQIYIHTDSRINRYNISNMKIIIALLLTICVAIATATTVKQQIQQLAASKSPADNIIALLGQVKETLEHDRFWASIPPARLVGCSCSCST